MTVLPMDVTRIFSDSYARVKYASHATAIRTLVTYTHDVMKIRIPIKKRASSIRLQYRVFHDFRA